MKLLVTNSTSTNFTPIALKFALVEFVLVDIVLVEDLLYTKEWVRGTNLLVTNSTKGGFFSEIVIRFSNLQTNIPKNFPELEI